MNSQYIFQDLWLYFKQCRQCWVVFGVIVVLLFIWFIYRRANSKFSIQNNSVGEVTISRSALNNIVRSICLKNPAIQYISSDFKKSGSKFSITVRLKAGTSVKVPLLSASLHEALSQALLNILGENCLSKVYIVIVGLRNDLEEGKSKVNADGGESTLGTQDGKI